VGLYGWDSEEFVDEGGFPEQYVGYALAVPSADHGVAGSDQRHACLFFAYCLEPPV